MKEHKCIDIIIFPSSWICQLFSLKLHIFLHVNHWMAQFVLAIYFSWTIIPIYWSQWKNKDSFGGGEVRNLTAGFQSFFLDLENNSLEIHYNSPRGFSAAVEMNLCSCCPKTVFAIFPFPCCCLLFFCVHNCPSFNTQVMTDLGISCGLFAAVAASSAPRGWDVFQWHTWVWRCWILLEVFKGTTLYMDGIL